jgi:hypothetical protein
MHPEQERRDDAEVAAAAADRPEQVGVLVGISTDDRAVGQHHLGLQQAVDAEPMLAGEMADAAAQGEAADAGRPDDAAGRGHAHLVGGAIDLAPGAAAAHPHGLVVSVDVDLAHRREVDHDAVVAAAEAAAVVAAPTHRQQRAVSLCEADHGRHIGGRGAARDQRRAAVDHPVVELARLVIAAVARRDQLARDA